MKLNCNKELLLDIVNTVQKAVMTKGTIPILECIKIDAHGKGNILVTSYNTDICIEYYTECDVPMGGAVALTSKMFGEIVRKLPEGNVSLSVNEDNYVTKIKCGASEFNIQGLNANDFPSPPQIEEKYRFTLTQEKLKDLTRKTIAFTAQNEGKRPILTGMLFEIKNGFLNVVSSDGHRLAYVKEPLSEKLDDAKFIIPSQTIRELLKLLKDEGNVDIIVSERHILFDFGYFKLYTRLMDGEFLKYESLMSVTNTIITVADKKEITDCLERAMLLINEDAITSTNKRSPVRFNINNGRIDIACITGRGQVNDNVNLKSFKGEELMIGFNCRFILDALAVCDDDEVKLEFSTALGGCYVKPTNPDGMYSFMILPVRLN